MKWVKVILWMALVSLVVGMVTRLTPVRGFPLGITTVTPSAFLRFTDTLILFAIAIMLFMKFSKRE